VSESPRKLLIKSLSRRNLFGLARGVVFVFALAFFGILTQVPVAGSMIGLNASQ